VSNIVNYETLLGKFPELTDDDILRRDIMESFRCYYKINKSDIETRYGIDFS
jgi:coproporphyrinogen III oxidase-like Fe-S oxidoreductase